MLLPVYCVKMISAIYLYTFCFHCIVVHDDGDVITEKSRRDRNFSVLCTMCAYVGFVNITHIHIPCVSLLVDRVAHVTAQP